MPTFMRRSVGTGVVGARMVDRGELAGVQVGRQLRIAPAELERLLEEPRNEQEDR
jgi:hypothetical protein